MIDWNSLKVHRTILEKGSYSNQFSHFFKNPEESYEVKSLGITLFSSIQGCKL